MLNTNDRIKKSLIQIQKRNSFWAYLSLYLKFKEIETGKMAHDTAGVSPDGEVCYVKDFIKSLDDEELIGLVTHELNHVAFLTELRRGDRDPDGFNFASDLAINSILKANNFKLPKDGVIPDHNDELKVGTKTIKNCSKLTTEEIYDILPKIKMKNVTYILGDGSGTELGKSFDVHLKGKDGKELSPKGKKALEKKWRERVARAVIVSQGKGDIPKGMEKLIERLHESKINWRVLLQRYIQNSLPMDFSYCVDKDTLIDTPKGKIKIKELKKGHIIYGYKNKQIIETKIKDKFKSKINKKYIIYTKKGKRIICSENHKFLTNMNKYIKAKDLKIGISLKTI